MAGAIGREVAWTLGVALLYVLTAQVGQVVAMPPGNITPVWLPSGIMLALAVVVGPRIAPGVFLGAFAGNAWAYFTPEDAVWVMVAGTTNGLGDVLATVGMALLLQRWLGSDRWFDEVRDVAAFVGVGAVLGGLISAAFGVGALVACGFMEPELASTAFLTWWTGDAVGVVLLAPPMLVWRDGFPKTWSGTQWAVAAVVLAATVGVGVIGVGLLEVSDPVKIGSLVVTPVLFWVSLDLGRRFSYLVFAVVGLLAILATALGLGPFQGIGPSVLFPGTPFASLVALQVFLGALSMTILLLSVIATQRAAARVALVAANAALAHQSRTDVLTGLPNRMHLNEVLDNALARAVRHAEPFSVVLGDIDHFKRVNDTFGHNAGDVVLQAVARELATGLRAVDMAGRWGGEEFLMVLDRCDDEGAGQLAERVRQRVAALDHPEVGCVTMSFGVAAYRPGDDRSSLVGRADAALYAAKASGRDRVVRWGALDTPRGCGGGATLRSEGAVGAIRVVCVAERFRARRSPARR